MRRAYSPLLSVFFLLGTIRAADLEVNVIDMEGNEAARQLLDISDTGFKFEHGNIAFKDVAEVHFALVPTGMPLRSNTPSSSLQLRNGDVICNTQILSGDESQLSIKNEAIGQVLINNKYWDAIEFINKERPSAETLVSFFQAPPPKEDMLLLSKMETVSGTIEKFREKDLMFNAGGQSREYTYDRLAAFRLAPLEDYTATTDFRATILFQDGSRITGKLIGFKDKELVLRVLDGQSWSIRTELIQSIVFKGGKLIYLSELNPKSVEEKPYVGGVPIIYRWRRDRSVTGGVLLIGKRTFKRGLGVHSYSKIIFDLNGQYIKFLCDMGLDAAAPTRAICAWRVIVDGKEVAKGDAQAGGNADSLKLDIQGARELELVCDYGSDDDDAGDYFDWANARLIKP